MSTCPYRKGELGDRRRYLRPVTAQDLTLAPFYKDWETYNARLVEAIRRLSAEQLAHRPFPQYWPIWAIAAHICGGARGFWLCSFLEEPGAETLTPFAPELTTGEEVREWLVQHSWEDYPDHPRSAEELAWALEATWKIIEGALHRWTPETMGETFSKWGWTLTRQSVVMRLLSHDAYHTGEISIALGQLGLPAIEIWDAPAD
jgi:uncharacterized damage-inducible protein DinB